MTPDSDQQTAVEQAKQLILTTYTSSLSEEEKQKINDASSAAEVALLADTFVKDKAEYGGHTGQYGSYDVGSYNAQGVSDSVAEQMATIVGSEAITSDNDTAHAAYLISQTDRNTSNGITFSPGNYVEYSNMPTVDDIITTRTERVNSFGEDVAKDSDNTALIDQLHEIPATVAENTTATNAEHAEAYDKYAQSMSEHIREEAADAAKALIADEQAQGKDLNGDGKVGYVKLEDFKKKDVDGAFAEQQAALQDAMQTDETGIIAQRYNQSVQDEKNVKAAVDNVQSQIDANNTTGAWSGVPKNIAMAEQRDVNAQLQQQKAKTQEFGVAVANMTPQERQDLDNFFTAAQERPEDVKKFVASVQARDKHVELIEDQIAANTVASYGTAIPKGVAMAEQRDMNSQLQLQKADVIAAPLDPDVNPAFVSPLNPNGSIAKQKELDAFFAAAKKAEDEKAAAAISMDVRISQINAYTSVPKGARDAAIAEVKKGNTSSASDLIKFFNGGKLTGGPSSGDSGSNNSSLVTVPPNPNKVQQTRSIPGKVSYQ